MNMNIFQKHRTKIQITLFTLFLLGMSGVGLYKFMQHQPDHSQTEKVIDNQTIIHPKTEKIPIVVQPNLATKDTIIHTQVRDSIVYIESQKEPVEMPKNDLTQIYIPLTKSVFALANVTLSSFQAVSPEKTRMQGKSYYQGENGAIESDLVWDEDGNLHEQLVSFDPSGRPVDNLEIGILTPEAHIKYASLSTNKISIIESVQTTKKNEERVTEYSITPQLQFRKGKTYLKIK
ncbi:hypothetical protein FACS189413_17410 [Bacteroidia bacterium]|nr:hypothetical protein FACS189463_1550 [Bacteroidia bacterium]GHU73240.1 hypothetical protein FACS189413_17410 [Bacteroidia bacterium]